MSATRTLGGWIIALGVFGLVIPFVGPLFNFGMGPDPAFAVTTSRVLRHVLPGIVIIAGGAMMFSGSVGARRGGAILAFLGGAVLAAAPLIFGNDSVLQFFRRLVYHWGTGIALVGMAAYAFGRLSAATDVGRGRHTPADARRDEHARVG